MADITSADISCGIDQLVGLNGDEKDIIKDIVEYYEWEGFHASMLLFSDNEEYGNGIRLAKFITKNKLGHLIKSRRVKNRNHPENTIQAWIWHLPPIRKLKKACGWTREDSKEVKNERRLWW
jgi:hypothetical protein